MTAAPSDLETRLRMLVDGLAKPVGSLGRIEDLAVQIGLVQRTTAPVAARCTHTIFAADHGLTAEGVSAFPGEVTRVMLSTFLAGGAAASVFARVVGARVRVVDAGVAGEPLDHPDLIPARVGAGTANSALGPAMTPAQCEEALARGREFGRNGDADVASFGEMGIGNTSAAALVCALVLGMPVSGLVGRGTGVDDAGLDRKVTVLEAVVGRVAREVPASMAAGAGIPRLGAARALSEVGGFEIAMMTGAILGAADAGLVVVIDGFVAGAAAVAALDLDPSVRAALVFGHRSAEAGHDAVLEAIGAEPLLDLGMRLGEGTGALLALPLVQAAAALLSEMASLESVGIETA